MKMLISDNLIRSVFKLFISSAGVRIFGMLLGFFVGVQLARGLGVESYGIYGLVISITSILSMPTEFGLPQLLTREVASAQVKKNWSYVEGIISWSTKVNIIISFIIMVFTWVVVFFLYEPMDNPLVIPLLVSVSFMFIKTQSNLRCAAIRGFQFIVKGQIPDAILQPLLFSISLLVIYFIGIELTPTIAISLGVFSMLNTFFISSYLLRKLRPKESFNNNIIVNGKEWIYSALPMALTEGMRVIQGSLVLIILGLIVSLHDVGIFRIANSTAMLIAMPLSLVAIASSPIVSKLYSQNNLNELERFLKITTVFLVFSSLFMVLPFIFWGDFIFSRVFGSEYIEANIVLIILGFGFVFSSFFGSNAILLNMCGKSKSVTKSTFLSLMSLLLMSVPLIHYYGINGGALACSLSIVFWQFMMWGEAKKVLKLDISIFYIFGSK